MNRYSYILDKAITQVPSVCYRIHEALIALNERGEKYISVRTLTDEAGIDRLDFYEYYDQLSDVEDEMENLLIGYLIEKGDDDYLEHTLSWIGENRSRFNYLINTKTSGSFYLKWRDAIRYHLVNWGIVEDTPENDFVIAGTSGMLISIFTLNITEDQDIDLKSLEERLKALALMLNERSEKNALLKPLFS